MTDKTNPLLRGRHFNTAAAQLNHHLAMIRNYFEFGIECNVTIVVRFPEIPNATIITSQGEDTLEPVIRALQLSALQTQAKLDAGGVGEILSSEKGNTSQ